MFFFENLPPIKDAIDSVNILRNSGKYNVHILTAPSTRNPSSYTEKRIWVENHFDDEFTNKLIISPNKGLLKGDILIDDKVSGKGQENFDGRVMPYCSIKFPNWQSILKELL